MYRGKDESWPQHSRPEARRALEEARQAGWWFRPSSGHTFGRLRCLHPEQHLDAEACVVPIYSTSGSEDGSETARVVRDAVRKCAHERHPPPEPDLDPEGAAHLATGTLSQVEALAEAGEGLLDKAVALSEAGAVLEAALGELAVDSNAAIESSDEKLAALERKAFEADGRAYAAASRAVASDPWPPDEGAQELLDQARYAYDEAARLVAHATGSSKAAALNAEADRIRIRLDRFAGLLRDHQ